MRSSEGLTFARATFSTKLVPDHKKEQPGFSQMLELLGSQVVKPFTLQSMVHT